MPIPTRLKFKESRPILRRHFKIYSIHAVKRTLNLSLKRHFFKFIPCWFIISYQGFLWNPPICGILPHLEGGKRVESLSDWVTRYCLGNGGGD